MRCAEGGALNADYADRHGKESLFSAAFICVICVWFLTVSTHRLPATQVRPSAASAAIGPAHQQPTQDAEHGQAGDTIESEVGKVSGPADHLAGLPGVLDLLWRLAHRRLRHADAAQGRVVFILLAAARHFLRLIERAL